jgi:hypothetical protein
LWHPFAISDDLESTHVAEDDTSAIEINEFLATLALRHCLMRWSMRAH